MTTSSSPPSEQKPSRKRLPAIVIAVCVVGLGIVWVTFPVWRPARLLDVTVLDKTCGDGGCEHRTLLWALDYLNVKPARLATVIHRYRSARAYIGFCPGPQDCDHLDHMPPPGVLYLADTFGAYYDGHHWVTSPLRGMRNFETEVLTACVNEGDVLVGEWNILDFPTTTQLYAYNKIQEIFGLEYTDWQGRYYDDLSDVPSYLQDLQFSLHKRHWNASGPGLIFVHEGLPTRKIPPDLLILAMPELKSCPVRLVNLHRSALTSTAAGSVPFDNWFEIHSPAKGATEIARFELRLPAQAQAILKRANIPLQFPATIVQTRKGHLSTVYFCGNFAGAYNMPARPYRHLCLARFLQAVHPGHSAAARFFWGYYLPVLDRIVEASY